MSNEGGVLTNGRIGEAPLIYFDLVGPWSAAPGIVRIELVAGIWRFLPGGGGTEVETVEVAHLRCSVLAARALVQALTDAIEMAEQPPQAVPEKPN